MQVLLLSNVDGLGHAGDIKDVPGGYAKNFLLPRHLAVIATQGAARQAQELKDAEERRKNRKLADAKSLANKVNGQTLTFQVRAGEGDKLYGSITGAEIADKLSRNLGMEIDRKHIELEHPLKSLGQHEVPVKLGSGVTATILVTLERAAE
jgi:large subunit ribosomal protein L9